MSTRSVIARAKGEGAFEGRYHHSDGYPRGLGKELYKLYNGHFGRDLDGMLAFLIDAHPAGWSTIQGADFGIPAGYNENDRYEKQAPPNDWLSDRSKPIPYGPLCFCHGTRHEPEYLIVNDASNNAADSDLEWAYVFEKAEHPDGEKRIMHVLQRMSNEHGRFWFDAGSVDLDALEPDWKPIECGDNLERCDHVAEYHFPELKGSLSARMGTRMYLGHEPLNTNDGLNAAAYIVAGKRYRSTGGRRGGFGVRTAKDRKDVWYSSLRDDNDVSLEAPTVLYTKVGVKPYPGVQWVFPPTAVNPNETIIG